MLKCKYNLRDVGVGTFLIRNYYIQKQLMQPEFNKVLPPPAEVIPLLDEMTVLQNGVLSGNIRLVAERNALRKQISGMVRDQCDFVNLIAYRNIHLLTASGFELCKQRAPRPLPRQVRIISVTNGVDDGEIVVKYNSAKTQCSYYIEHCLREGDWGSGFTTTKRQAVIKGLPVRRYIYVRVRGMNARGHGLWSEPMRVLVGR